MSKMLWIAAAGAVGTVARYILTGLVQRIHDTGLPLGTFAVNVIGCFLFGLVWSITENRLFIGDENRAVVLSGFMGAFTTFSTFIFENGELLHNGQWSLVTLNIVAQIVIGLVSLLAGIAVGRII